MPGLRDRFVFSAHNLQAYVDCARRFELLYREELSWPAEPVASMIAYERQMEIGRIFHVMAQRHLSGIHPDDGSLHEYEELAEWWSSFEQMQRRLPAGAFHVEKALACTMQEMAHPLVATFDLVVLGEDNLTIYDWKTSRSRPGRTLLKERLQTKVYLYLASRVFGDTIPIDSMQMVYWFTNYPDNPEVFAYSREQRTADEAYLLSLMHEMAHAPTGTFEMTENKRTCQLCVYRSLCNRGVKAGEAEDAMVEVDELLDKLGPFEDIDAIAF